MDHHATPTAKGADMHPRDLLNATPALPSSSDRLSLRGRDYDLKAQLGHPGAVSQGEFSLAESAEEISFHMAHRIEDKIHSERKVRGERVAADITIESILAHLNSAAESDIQARLDALAEAILSGRTDPRSAIASFSENLTHQYLALHYVIQKGRRERAPEPLLAEIADARAELEELHGPAIRAELNTIDAASAYARDASDIRQFQRTYEDVVLGDATLAKTLSLALSRFGGKRVADGLRGLIQALGLDLAAARPSVSKERIHAILKDMYHLEVAVTVLDGCRELGTRLTDSVRASFNAERLMQQVVNLLNDKWISVSSLTALAQDQGVETIPDRVAFLAGVRSVLKDLPLQVFPDDEVRAGVLETAQYALDAAIDEELT